MPSVRELAKVISEDGMKKLKEEIYNAVLDKNRVDLCKKILPEGHFPLLRQRKVFSKSVEQEILANVTTEKQVTRFIDELQRVGGTRAFPAFIESIDRTQIYLKELLNRSCEEMEENVPLEILNKHWNVSRLLEDLPGPTPQVQPLTEDEEQEQYPPIDLEKLAEVQETYNKLLKGEEEEEDDDDDEDEDDVEIPVLPDEGQRMNQF